MVQGAHNRQGRMKGAGVTVSGRSSQGKREATHLPASAASQKRACHATRGRKSSPSASVDSEYVEAGSLLAIATGMARKARGLLATDPDERTLLLMPCNDVHTVGMRHAIDVAFVDRRGCVVETHRAVGPLRHLRNKKAVAVIERFTSCDTPWFLTGDHVVITGGREDHL